MCCTARRSTRAVQVVFTYHLGMNRIAAVGFVIVALVLSCVGGFRLAKWAEPEPQTYCVVSDQTAETRGTSADVILLGDSGCVPGETPLCVYRSTLRFEEAC